MDRSRSKRNYYYDHESDSQTPPPLPRSTKPRFHHNYPSGGGGGDYRRRGVGDRRPKIIPQENVSTNNTANNANPGFTTSYRILCPDIKAGSVIGKSGSIIKSFRQETGAWINVHPLLQGDEERIIETSDNRRKEPDGRPPLYSPAQEALLMIHERILDAEFEFGGGGVIGNEEEMDEYGGWERERGGGGAGRVTTRLVVQRMHVGCLMGKGGKIIEQMRMETRTHIRILPRDQNMPRCVTMADEIVQVVGDASNVKKAVAIISDRLKESMHRDRGPYRGRLQSPDHFLPQDEEYGSYMNNVQHRSDGVDPGTRSSGGFSRSRNNYASRSSGYAIDAETNQMPDPAQSYPLEDIVFRILCPNDKVEKILEEPDGLLQILRGDVGVDVRITDYVHGSQERVIIISSEEGPDDELFPAQEALLHVQSHIVDLGPDKDNVITTRLLVSAAEIGGLEGRESNNGSLDDIKRLTSADVQILPRNEHPLCAYEADELIQIVGEIRTARNALVEITSRLRNYIYRDMTGPEDMISPSVSFASRSVGAFGNNSSSPDKVLTREGFRGSDNSDSFVKSTAAASQLNVIYTNLDTGASGNGAPEQQESNNAHEESQQTDQNSSSSTLVAKKTLEVVVPQHAIRSLTMKSGSKLVLISEMSGATVNFVEDKAELTQKIIQISGSPEQAEKAQSLLQGFILSTLDDTD